MNQKYVKKFVQPCFNFSLIKTHKFNLINLFSPFHPNLLLLLFLFNNIRREL